MRALYKFAERVLHLETESAFDVLVRARELESKGREVIHLEIGEPDFATPPQVVEAGARALREGWTHYGPPAGLPQLRQAVAEQVSHSLAIPVDPAEVIITPGAKPIMFFALLALIEPGDEVIYPDPGFPIYASLIRFVGAKPVPIRLHERLDFALDLEELERKVTPRTRLLILNSPQNPTGSVLPRELLENLAKFLAEGEITVLSDEIYGRIIFEGYHTSIAQFPGMKERTVILDGFSKAYAMTGWRLGYGVMRQELAEQMARLMVNSNSCTASFTQIAGLEALRGPQQAVENMVEEFRRRRTVVVEGLNRIPGFRCQQPHGAFYVFPNIRDTGLESKRLADRLLEEAGVATLAGSSFGAGGEGFLRISYANSVENIRKALERIESWVRTNLRF